MDKYYYLISQLPLLQFGKKTYLTKEFFLEEAEKWLDFSDFNELKKAGLYDLSQKARTCFLRNYKEFELALRKELVLYRENKKRQSQYQPRKPLTKEFLEGNPLEVEKKLFFLLWETVEELSQGFTFSREAVFAYFIKLQILEAVSKFDKEEGIQKFDELAEVEDEKIS